MSIFLPLPYCENMNYYSKLVNALDNDELEYAEFKNSEMLTKIVEIENILHLAIRNRRLDVIEFCANNAMVKLHPNPETGGLNPIELANLLNFHETFEYGDDEVLRKLMDRNVNEYLCVGKFNCTPLYVAVHRTRYDVVELLLKKGADPNIGFEKIYSKDGTTSLHWICDIIANDIMPPFHSYDLVELIELLIQYKADVNAKDSNGHSPMFRLFNQVKVFDSALWESSKLFLKHSPNVMEINEKKENVLHLIASWYWFTSNDVQSDHVALANSLLDLGADVNATDCNGNTPLQIAVSNAVPYLVKLFLDHEADARNIMCEWKNFNLKRIRFHSFHLIQNVLDIIELIKNRIDYMDDSWDLTALDLFITIRNHYPIMDFFYAFTLGSTNDVVNYFTSQNSPPLIVASYFHMVQIGQLYIDTEKSNPDKIYPILINSNYRKIIGFENFEHYPLSYFVKGHFAKSFIDRYVKHKGVEFLLELTHDDCNFRSAIEFLNDENETVVLAGNLTINLNGVDLFHDAASVIDSNFQGKSK
uniref:Uncharacterized protein n=1 Tax=Trichogramma kaykai TaxID=54128 RepID=A0ABD2XII2_9HYME